MCQHEEFEDIFMEIKLICSRSWVLTCQSGAWMRRGYVGRKAPTESSCNSKKHNKRRKIINENDENDKRKLSEPRLTLDFPHHETSEHERLLSVWKIWTPHFSSQPIDNNEKKLYIGEEIMWYDKGWWWNIFSLSQIISIVCHSVGDFSSWKFRRNFAMNDVKDASSLPLSATSSFQRWK